MKHINTRATVEKEGWHIWLMPERDLAKLKGGLNRFYILRNLILK